MGVEFTLVVALLHSQMSISLPIKLAGEEGYILVLVSCQSTRDSHGSTSTATPYILLAREEVVLLFLRCLEALPRSPTSTSTEIKLAMATAVASLDLHAVVLELALVLLVDALRSSPA